jgi:uncharacterized Ntn-hydrolase superfamily protein
MAFLSTFSIIARDTASGELGVAVQTHWFAVGTLCLWIEAGVGAVATQSMVEPAYGPGALDLMRQGYNAKQALEKLLGDDADRELRQVAIVDTHGNVAVHTGNRCVAFAGHQDGESFSVQANMMANASVWPAMHQAFISSKGELAERMLAALKAGQSAGGDIRGQQSAALLVANAEGGLQPWRQVKVNLRVDDHPRPIEELDRLLKVHNAYILMNAGDNLLAEGKKVDAREKYRSAARLAPGNDELLFWGAVTMADSGFLEDALTIFKTIFNRNTQWFELLQRLPAAGLFNKDPKMMKIIQRQINHERSKND